MTLSEFVAQEKRAAHDDLLAGRDPSRGTFSAAILAEGRTKGDARMGPAVLHADRIELQFLFGASDPTILVIAVAAPERIVFMPVPGWVVENIWQGDIAGSAHFASNAAQMVHDYALRLEAEANIAEFGSPIAIGRH